VGVGICLMLVVSSVYLFLRQSLQAAEEEEEGNEVEAEGEP